MKIEILKENLKNGLGVVERVVGKNISLPILDNVLMGVENNFLSLTSTDLETVIKIWILSKIINKGSVVVPAKFLSSFISYLPEDKVTLEVKGQNLHIESKSFTTQIQGYNPEDFPIIPTITESDYLEINNRKLCEALSQVANIASTSQTRPETAGIYFHLSSKGVVLVATDSFRLAQKQISLTIPTTKEYSFILPQKSAREVLNILDDKEGSLKLYFSNNQVLFELPMKEVDHPQIQITSRLVDGQYPNYQDIIPTKFKTTIVLKREDFLQQIKTASLFSNRNNEVKVSIDPDGEVVKISSQNPAVGEHNSTLPTKAEGDALTISFNHKFLIDGLLNIKSSELSFDISKEDGPCILRPLGDASYLYVVMPIKSM